MIYRSGLLMVVLCVQLLLIAGVVYLDATAAASDQAERLLDFALDDVDQIVVSESDAEVSLHKLEELWVIGEQLPADADKIAEVLEKLAGLRMGWPVATSPSTQDRFEVAADNHQRRIRLYQAEAVVAEMYLGSSPGYRRVHARTQGSDDIFSVDFSTFEVPTGTDDWLDKTLLGAAGEISEVSRGELWTLRKSAEGWMLDDPATGAAAAADQDAAKGVVERLRNLRVMGLAGSGAASGSGASGSEAGRPIQITVTDANGEQELSFWHDVEADEYVVGSSRQAGRFSVASYVAEQLIVAADDLAASEAE